MAAMAAAAAAAAAAGVVPGMQAQVMQGAAAYRQQPQHMMPQQQQPRPAAPGAPCGGGDAPLVTQETQQAFVAHVLPQLTDAQKQHLMAMPPEAQANAMHQLLQRALAGQPPVGPQRGQ
jgi:hypothetical protein